MEPTKSVGIWIRVSTEDQVKGESPEHHEKRARLYAEAKGWDVKKVYRLEALSGKSVMGYPQTKEMLADIRSGHITGLIFSKLARLARNTKELLDFADIFKEENADLISLQESIDTSTPAGRLFYTMIAAMAQWEREEIASRVAASVPIRAKLGKSLGGQASYGYKWEGKELVIDEKEAPIRKLMYELFAEHKRKGTVSDLLNKKGYRTRNGSAFSDTTVGRLLEDPTAKGMRRANYTKSLGEGKNWIIKPESEWVVTPCPAIVSEALWNECNHILAEQEKTKKKPTKKPVHLFTGLVFCDCGSKMHIPSESKKYICLKCRKNRIDMTDLEEIFYENLKSFLLTDQHLESFLAKADEIIASKQQELDSLTKEQKRITAEMDKMTDLYVSGEIPKEGFGKKYNPLQEQLNQIENSIPELQGEIDFLRIEYLNGDQLLSEAKSLYDRWPSLELESKRSIAEQITDSIIISKDEIKFKFSYSPHSPLSKIPTDSQRNFIPALTFWKVRMSFKNPLFVSLSDHLGDHIKRKRLSLGVSQEAVGKILKVSTDSITYWENKRSKPEVHHFPAIMEFLGYDPFNIDTNTFGGRIKYHRYLLGLSRKKFAKIVGADGSTIADLEEKNNVRKYRAKTLQRIENHLFTSFSSS